MEAFVHNVVIGAGLTGLATAFQILLRGQSVHIIEQSDRIGGQIHTHNEKGFVFESGPNTGVISYPEVAELFNMLNERCQLETAHKESKRRLIWKGNKFRALPSGLFSAITTPLFTLEDKYRILNEPLCAQGDNPDESVGELTLRRLGKSFLDYAVDPFLSGVYAGDPMKLVTRYALPKLYNLEQEYGSLIRGAIVKALLRKTDREKLATKQLFSAAGGLENLIRAMVTFIGKGQIRLSASNASIQLTDNDIWPGQKRWQVSYKVGATNYATFADNVITTTGAYSLPALLPFIPKEEIEPISNLEYAPVVQVSVGLNNVGRKRFNAFGGLVPSCENKNVLGILFPSACFSGRAPEKGALFSFFLGGVKHAELITWPDEKIEALVVEQLHSMLKFPARVRPDLIRIFRHPHAIPQYEQNSGIRFQTINKLEQQHPGLILGGNIKGGIGMADRIHQAVAIAERLKNEQLKEEKRWSNLFYR